MAKKDFLGSDYDYHRTDIGMQNVFGFLLLVILI